MLAALLPLSLLLPQEPAPPPPAFDLLPLQHLCAARTGLTPPVWGSLLTYPHPDDDRRPDLLGCRDDSPQFDPQRIVALISRMHTPAIEANTLALSAPDGGLLVLGDAAAVGLVRDQLRELGAVLARPLTVEATLWDAGTDAAPPPVLQPREFAQFAGQHTPLWRSQSLTRTGIAIALDGQRWTRYVRNIAVEVAQKATISNPVTDAFGEGGRVVVAPHSLLGGDDFALHVQFGLATRRGPVGSLSTGIPGQADIDVPLLDSTYGACSGRITNSGALCITMAGAPGAGSRHVLTVRILCRVPPAAPQTPSVGIFPISALASTALLQRIAPPDPYPAIGDHERGGPQIHGDGEAGCMPADQLVELIRTALGTEAENDFELEADGGHLFVHAPAAKVARVEALLRSLQDRQIRTVAVRHTVVMARAAGQASDDTLHELVLPTLLGRHATLCRQFETNVLRDVFVEIAQEASSNSSLVESLQIGCWLRARVAAIGDGMHLQMLAQCTHGEVPAPRRMAPAGTLTPPDTASTRAAHDGPVASGQPIDHGDGPIVLRGGQPARSAMATTVSW